MRRRAESSRKIEQVLSICDPLAHDHPERYPNPENPMRVAVSYESSKGEAGWR
jgi:hypothetical protein